MIRSGNASTTIRRGLAVLSLLVSLLSLSLTAAGKRPFAGTWEGTVNGQPAVALLLNESGGEVSGAMVFYFQLRGEDGKWHVKDKHEVPLLAPAVDGNTLSFEVIHHKAHGSSELAPNVKYRMEFTRSGQAILHQTTNQVNHGPGLQLTRRQARR